jgi:hypothetical protein
MAFDPVAYSQMLDDALGYAPTRRPPLVSAMGPAQSGTDPTINAPPSFGEGGRPAPTMQGGLPMSIDGAAPARAPAPGTAPVAIGAAAPGAAPGGAPGGIGAPIDGKPGMGKIQAKPPFKVKYKEGALKEVKTTGDLIDAMKPKSQREYMDWWEQQYGNINQRYNDLQKQLGRRPDADGDLTRKDQFRMLMEFGMELMARAGKGEQGAGSAAFASSYERAKGRKAGQAAEYDARSQMIEKGRGEELKAIGSYGDALKGQATIDTQATQMQEAEGRMAAAKRRRPEIISADQGTFDYDPETRETTAITGIDGKPLTNREVGSRGGVARDSRVAEEKRFDHLMSLGMPKEAAMRIAYKQPSGDPRKDYLAVFKSAMSSNYGDERKAKEIADSYIEFTYPGETVDKRSQPMLPSTNDPLGLRD